MDIRALYKLSYGLYIVGAKKGERFNGQIANTAFQITPDPPTIAVSIAKENLTHEFIEHGGVFTVSVLSRAATMQLIGHFGFKSGRDINKCEGIDYKVGECGAPVFTESCLAYIEAEVIDSLDVFTHTIFVGKIIDAKVLSDEEQPITYDYYHKVKKGKTPKAAATYVDEEKLSKEEEGGKPEEAKKMQEYECTVCGYVYDPEAGDPDSGVEPGTPFENLPEDWVCPVCGVGKDSFESL